MSSSWIDWNSLLAIDVGAVNTRAVLFDIIEGEYRFVASGTAPSTVEAPFKDALEGVSGAVLNLQGILGKKLLDPSSGGIITPTQGDGSGVDALVATISAGPVIKTIIVGLLKEVSLDSVRKLAETSYARIVGAISLNDSRRPDQQIDRILNLRPDLVLIAGGTDGGASTSIHKLLEPLSLASFLLPEEKRPSILFAGNEKLGEEVKSLFGSLASSLHFSPNIRRSLETEDLGPAERELAHMTVNIRKHQVKGVEMLDLWSGGHILPTAYASGRMVRFLGRIYNSPKGILSVDLGASAAVIAAGFGKKSVLKVFPQYGLGENLAGLLSYTTVEEILRWSSVEIQPAEMRDYLYQKSLYPSTIPATREDLMILHAVARQALYLALQSARRDFPKDVPPIKPGLAPLFELILAGGSVFTGPLRPGQSLLLLLDALQPVGVTTILIDQNGLLPLLGAASTKNQLLPVQVLKSGAFLSFGTIIAPVVSANNGAVILKVKITYENGAEVNMSVKYGSIETLPLPGGEMAKLTIKCARGADIGFGPGRGGTIQVGGGAMGIVLDGRGRPLNLPADAGHRRELFRKWNWSLGVE